jgi:hypothetical protein
MIDPVTAFAAIKSAHSAIMGAIKVGKDVSSLTNAAAKYAKGEAALQSHSEVKKKGLLAKLGMVEGDAIDSFFRKKEQDELRDELRSAFQLYGKPGAWQALQGEIASVRAEKAKEYKRELLRKKMIKDICIAFLIVGMFALALSMFGFIFVQSSEVAYYAIY